jgi:hypothetical protein
LARKNEFKLATSGERITTFHQLIQDANKHSNFYLLNPIVGPEPIVSKTFQVLKIDS